MPKTIGKKAARHPMDREWTSGIFKERNTKPTWLGKTKLAGDGQADLKHHGGLEKAVFAYPSEHYLFWQNELNFTNIMDGGMGENFLLENQLEDQVAIGDTYRIGKAIIQVSQPRQPCWKPARRFKVKNLALLLQNTGRTGWYFRVLQEGYIQEGDVLRILDRPFPEWTIEKCNGIMHMKNKNMDEAKALSACELLSENWRMTLHDRVEKGIIPNMNKRVIGPNE